MEAPDGWDALTAALAVCPLGDLPRVWAFLRLQDLLSDAPDSLTRFQALAQAELARGEITGPSMAWRIAYALTQAGLTLPAADLPDPLARRAGVRWEQVQGWRGDAGTTSPATAATRRGRAWWQIF